MVALNFLKEPWERQTLAETTAAHQAVGEDVAANLSFDYAHIQIALVPYRIKRLGTELSAAFAQPGAFFFSGFGFLTYVYCAIVYSLMFRLGRLSPYELPNPPAISA
jgi:hypothetical protein